MEMVEVIGGGCEGGGDGKVRGVWWCNGGEVEVEKVMERGGSGGEGDGEGDQMVVMKIGEGGCYRRWEGVGEVVARDEEGLPELGAARVGQRRIVRLVAWPAQMRKAER